YLTPPLVVFALLGLGLAVKERHRPAGLVALLSVLPLLAFASVSTLWFPRYLVSLIVPGVLLAAFGFIRLAALLPRLAGGSLLPLPLVPAIRVDLDLLVDPPQAATPAIDREQLILGWPSGYGTEGTVAFVREELRHHPDGITVVAHSASRRTTWLAL